MPNVKFQIANQTHQLICSEGEQQHITNLASQVNLRVRNLANQLGTGSDSTIIAVAAITMQDEIMTLKKQLHDNIPATANPELKYSQQDMNNALENELEPLVKILEKLASKLNK